MIRAGSCRLFNYRIQCWTHIDEQLCCFERLVIHRSHTVLSCASDVITPPSDNRLDNQSSADNIRLAFPTVKRKGGQLSERSERYRVT